MCDHDDDSGTRQIGLDYLRGFVVVLVVLHHAVLAYCGFGHSNPEHYTWSTAPIVDSQRWVGFDLVVLFNDSYFMPLMFLLSGLFVGPSLERKGPKTYLWDRFWRLAVPFALAVLTIIPLAYYPSYRMTGAQGSFATFWIQTVFDGPWPSGPPWFIAALFGLDLAAIVAQPLLRRLDLRRVGRSFLFLATVSLLAYLPLLILYGPDRWFTWGPLAIQASRILLYAAYFFVGVGIGPAVHVRGRAPVKVAVMLFAMLLAVQTGRLHTPMLVSPVTGLMLYDVALALFCAAATRTLVAVFAGFPRRFAIWDNLSANAYGIYLVHYLFVTWGQYALLEWRIGAIPKAVCVFGGALASSWSCSIVFRWAKRSVAGYRKELA